MCCVLCVRLLFRFRFRFRMILSIHIQCCIEMWIYGGGMCVTILIFIFFFRINSGSARSLFFLFAGCFCLFFASLFHFGFLVAFVKGNSIVIFFLAVVTKCTTICIDQRRRWRFAIFYGVLIWITCFSCWNVIVVRKTYLSICLHLIVTRILCLL